jgi:hypothetical protein
MHLRLIYTDKRDKMRDQDSKTVKWRSSDYYILIHEKTHEIIRAMYFVSRRLGKILVLPHDPNRYKRIDVKREGWQVIEPSTNYYKDNNIPEEDMWPFSEHQLVPVMRQGRT